jgi:hypothetical protein
MTESVENTAVWQFAQSLFDNAKVGVSFGDVDETADLITQYVQAATLPYQTRIKELEKTIEEAPHGEACSTRYDHGMYPEGFKDKLFPCTCWKSKYISGEG